MLLCLVPAQVVLSEEVGADDGLGGGGHVEAPGEVDARATFLLP